MTPTETVNISHVAELFAHNGYDVSESSPGVLRVREIQSGVALQAALEGGVLFMSVNLTTCPSKQITADLMRKMLSGENGISTSAFRLYDAADGRTTVALGNFCKLQDMGAEDHDDILSLAGYLLADVVEARELFQSAAAAR
jgi:hypothetical protein